MADFIEVTPGSPPWAPAPDAQLVEAYDIYDLPLSGVVEQAGVTHLFACLGGQTESVNIWAYAPLFIEERMVLETSEGEEFKELLESFITSRPVLLAIAEERVGIVDSSHLDDWNLVPEVVTDLFARLERWASGVVSSSKAEREVVLAALTS